jgi:UDP-glucose 4-epimerase
MKTPHTLNILVTGGAGFIGSHVARAYVQEGHNVVVLDDLSTGSRTNVPKEATFVRGDLETVAFATLLGDHAIDLVNHHAAHIDLRASVADPVADARTNILGSLRLLEGCRRAGVRRIVFASTGGAIYGEPRGASSSESDPTDPVSPYGVAKLAVEKYLHVFRVAHGFQTVIFRYANVYGPGQTGSGEAGVVAILLERMLAGRVPVIHGDGEQTRDFVFIRDCVDANRWALGFPGSGIWNIGTGVETSVNRLFDLLCDATGKQLPAAHDAPAPGEQRRSVLNGEKYLNDFGVSAYTSLRDGLSETVARFPRPR